jgi:hypothetical protein
MEDYKNIKYKRITYIDHPKKEGYLKSSHTFISAKTGAEYEVQIDTVNKVFHVKNIKSESIIYSSTNRKINNRNVLLRYVKRYLMYLGVSFQTELRDRTFGRCEKGYTQRKHKEIKQITNSTSNNGLDN